MKKHDLKSIIKEEIKKILNEENETDVNVDPEKESFLKQLNNLRAGLLQDPKGLSAPEKENLLDLFNALIDFARNKNLTQQIEDRILRILVPTEELNEMEPAIKGSANLKPLIEKLPGVDVTTFMMAYNAIKTGKDLTLPQQKAMGNVMVGLIKSPDDQLLNKILVQLKNIEG